MFSGIIKDLGEVVEAEAGRLLVRSDIFRDKKFDLGSSIAVSGVCLSIVEQNGEKVLFELASETLERTSLGALKVGSKVNLEPALCLGEPLDGHLVLGHADGVSELLEVERPDANTIEMRFSIPTGHGHLLAKKGSVCLSGVSLTVGEIDSQSFKVYIIPLTAKETTLGELEVGDVVNFEVDCVARYLERLLEKRG